MKSLPEWMCQHTDLYTGKNCITVNCLHTVWGIWLETAVAESEIPL